MTWPILRPGRDRGLAVEVHGGIRRLRASGRRRSRRRPSRLVISTRPRRIGLPSGKPATARMCCSNCDTEAPSMVQWPELCTRGAISLTSTAWEAPSSHDEHLDRQHADIAEGFRDGLGDAPRFRGDRRRHGGRHARGLQDVVLMRRSRSRRRIRSARRGHAPPPPKSRVSNGTKASRICGWPPRSLNSATGSPPLRIIAWPLPS